jgi:hypothetical protein
MSLNSIKQFFVMETRCVFFAVRTEFLNTTSINFCFEVIAYDNNLCPDC